MRYFRSSSEVFDAFRDMIAELLGLPSNGTVQPWHIGITHLALAPHEYSDERYAPMIERALADGIVEEITEAEYLSSLPTPPEEP